MGKVNTVDLDLIREKMTNSWIGVAAFAEITGIPVKTALKGCKTLYESGEFEMKRYMIDGHNRVHAFRKAKYIKLFGVNVLVNSNKDEL